MADSEIVALWDHVDRDEYRGILSDAAAEMLAVNPLCGDEVRLQLRIGAAGRVAAARFTGRGCRVSQQRRRCCANASKD
jgi:nitrogen fixation NifU-like protein